MSSIKKTLRENKYNEVKKKHDKYFVTYHPINRKTQKFACLSITFIELVDIKEIASIMEEELDKWISKFPLPLKVDSFDEKGDSISLKSIKENNYLVGFLNRESNRVVKSWNMKALPEGQLADLDIDLVYKGLSYKKRACVEKEIENKIRKRARDNKIVTKFFDTTLLLWLSVSITIYFLGWKSHFVGGMAFFYSVYRALRRFCFKKGYKTKAEKKEQEKKRKMEHYYYHCERNPKGFIRLKAENFGESEKEKIKKEKEDIKD